MRIRRGIAALAASAALAGGIVATAVPAGAADTTTTFTLTGGALNITAPASADIGSFATGLGSVSGQLGAVQVTDARGALVATWIATVASTDFTTGGASSDETVVNDDIRYSSGARTASTGIGVFTPSVNVQLDQTRTAGALTLGVGNNSSTWNPTLNFTLQGTQVAGTYTGTVTHSVS
jgi:hypothetical protein